jgi:hypothetical protein
MYRQEGSVLSADLSKAWMQCAERDDKLRYASNHPYPLMPIPAGKPAPAQCSRNKALELPPSNRTLSWLRMALNELTG